MLNKKFVERPLGIINELEFGPISNIWTYGRMKWDTTESAPKFRMTCSFFPDAVATTLAPLDFAIWIAKAPVAELPPFMKTVCSGSLNVGYLVECLVRGQDSNSNSSSLNRSNVGWSFHKTTRRDRMYWDKAPCRVLSRIVLGTHP